MTTISSSLILLVVLETIGVLDRIVLNFFTDSFCTAFDEQAI